MTGIYLLHLLPDSGFFQKCSVEYFGKLLLGMHGKIPLHHPVVILWLLLQYISDGPAFMLAEIKDLDTVFKDKPPCKVYDGLVTQELYNGIYVITQLRILAYLGR